MARLPWPAPAGARAAVFDTRIDKARWLVGSAAQGVAKLLSRRNYSLAAEPESFFVTTKEPIELLPGELVRARDWGNALAAQSAAKA